MSKSPKRPYAEIFPVAKRIVERLRPYCQRIELAGSLRRGRPLVGDIELVALPRAQLDLFGNSTGSRTLLDRFLEESGVQFAKNGKLYKQFAYGRHTVDLFLPASPEHWGSIFQIRTGSHGFNMWIQNAVALAADVRFKEGRLYRRSDSLLLDSPEEDDVFRHLQLPWIPPQHRDDEQWLAYVPVGHPVSRRNVSAREAA